MISFKVLLLAGSVGFQSNRMTFVTVAEEGGTDCLGQVEVDGLPEH